MEAIATLGKALSGGRNNHWESAPAVTRAQFVFIPFMTMGTGVDLIGGWFGTGADRGIALLFTLTGLIGLIVTLLAMRSHAYQKLATKYSPTG